MGGGRNLTLFLWHFLGHTDEMFFVEKLHHLAAGARQNPPVRSFSYTKNIKVEHMQNVLAKNYQKMARIELPKIGHLWSI